MTYHTLRGNSLGSMFVDVFRQNWRRFGLALGILLYGCAIALLTARAVNPTFECQAEDEAMIEWRGEPVCITLDDYFSNEDIERMEVKLQAELAEG